MISPIPPLDPTIATAKDEEESPHPPVRAAQILLVDDQPSILFVARSYLEMLGFRCDTAKNGAEAVKKVVEEPFSLMLIDLQMPVMDGLEATRRIRMREDAERLPRMPIIGMTAYPFEGNRERCIEVGMDDFVTKPFEPADLKSILFFHLGDADASQ